MKLPVSSLLCLCLAACGGDEAKVPETGADRSAPAPAPESRPSEPEEPKDPFLEPFTSFSHQLDMVRRADVEGLRACVIDEIRDQVKLEDLELIAEHFATLPPGDYARFVEPVGDDRVELKWPSRITFGTLRRVDGKWLAETAWWNFRGRQPQDDSK
ncbi:MAG: hypothetical protein KDB80_15580 [Planctomycetes bacterium]|nr:hypothetical protein [Planctomycetota bacterium]